MSVVNTEGLEECNYKIVKEQGYYKHIDKVRVNKMKKWLDIPKS